MNLTYFDAFTRIGLRPRMHPRQRWSLLHLVEEMRHCSISAALVSSHAQLEYDAMLENRRLVEALRPYDFLFPIWNVMPHWTGECPEPAELVREMAERNVRAVTLCPKANGWKLGSRQSKPLLDELARAGTLTILDMSSQVDWIDLEQLLDEHPTLQVLVRGVAWAQQRLVVPLLRRYANLHIGFDTFQINRGIERLTDWGCEDQLVFCTNAPSMSMGAHRFYVDYADVSESVKRKIAGGNLTRLLRGLAPPREIVNRDEDPIMAEARQGKPLSTLVIDFHAHILDEGLHGAGNGYTMYDGGPGGVLKLAQRMGVDAIGLMSWNGVVGAQGTVGNDCVRAALDALPESWWGLGTFDVIHHAAEELRAQMEELFRDPRFLGLKPYPSYGVPYSDPRYDVWWQFGNERKLYCGIHPVHWYQPGEFESICSRFPDLTVVAYHSGGSFEIADTVIDLARRFPNLMAEITLTPVPLGMIDDLAAGMGADRVLYGSDLPMRDPRQQLGWVVYSRLSVEDKKKVLGGNAKRLLDRIRGHQRQTTGDRAAATRQAVQR